MNKTAQAYAQADIDARNAECANEQSQVDEELAQETMSDENIDLSSLQTEPSNEELAEQAEIAKLKQALAAEREIRLRDAAEFENIKKRIERQNASDLEYANSKIIKDLLPILDALDQALSYEQSSEGTSEGIENIIKLFSKVLENYGVQKIMPNLGDAVDPDIHEVLLNQPNPELEPGTISMVMQCGYRLKDRTIRAAKVAANN